MALTALPFRTHVSLETRSGTAEELSLGLSRISRLLLILVVLSATVLNRFGINFGAYSLNFSLIAIYLLVGMAMLSGTLTIVPDRVVAYCLCVVVAFASYLVNTNWGHVNRSSWTSLLLLVAIYFPFVFAIGSNGCQAAQLRWVMRVFSNVALICACAGIVQYYAQFIVHGDWLFDFTPYIPFFLQGPSGFNTAIPIDTLYKSNGFFLREPSSASLVMALGLLVEAALFHRPLRMAGLAFALILTYSGTGLVALLIGIGFSIKWRTVGRMTAGLAVAGACIWALGDVLNLGFTFGRIGEFNSDRSSAHMRYIAPMRLVSDVLFAHPWSFWLGLGPGTILRLSQAVYQFHDPTWAKLLIEYGVLGFAAFVGLMAACVRQRLVPIQLLVVLFASWLVMGGHLLTPENVYLVFVLTGLFGCASSGVGRQQVLPSHQEQNLTADDRICNASSKG